MTSQPTRIGLIGDGPVANAYAAAIGPPGEVDLVRVAGAAGLADLDVSGVIATTPDAAMDVIALGKPLLIQLSGTETSAQIEQVRAAAMSAGVPLVVARPWRFHDVARSFRASVEAGDVGPPAFFHWVDEGDGGQSLGFQANGDGPAAGALAGIDLALWLLDERPARIYARQTGGGVTISLRCQGGANALIERRPGSASGDGYGFAWLLGPRGEVRWNQRADGVSVSGGQPSLPPLEVGACLRTQVAEALARWDGAHSPTPELDGALHAAATISAANDSMRLGQPVTIATDWEGGSNA